MNSGTPIGRNLRALMKARNVTVRALAAEVGVSHATVQRWRAGERMPTNILAVFRAAAFFGVSTHWFVTGEPDPFEGVNHGD